MRRNGQNSTGQILTQNLKFPWTVSYLNMDFGGASCQDLCFPRKTAIVMQHFGNLLASRVGVKIF